MSRTFILIDGSSLLYRAFYALPLLKSARGQYTNAVYGFTTMLVKLIGEVKPDALVVAFDKGKVTFRNEMYPEYKAQRKSAPPELAEQFPLIREVLSIMGVRVFEEAGFEADDIIGTFACRASRAGFQVKVVTGDRDALQLIDDNIRVLLTRKGITEIETMDKVALKDKFGVTPEQIIDLKGLMGDTSDNIPGVPGVGEKTAGKLISEFGSVENVLANLDKVSGPKLRETLKNNADLARLSKKLATIVCDLPLEFIPENYIFSPNIEKTREIFTELEFKSLITRLKEIVPGASDEPVQVTQSLPEVSIAETEQNIRELIEEVAKPGILAYYPLLSGHVPKVVIDGVGLAFGERQVYISAGTPGWDELMQTLLQRVYPVVVYDSKLVTGFIVKNGKEQFSAIFDVGLAAYLLDPTANDYSITRLSELYLKYQNNWQEKQVAHEPAFAAWAAGSLLKLYPVMQQTLKEAELTALLEEIEMPLAAVLSQMEMSGIKVDREHLKLINADIAGKVEKLLEEIYITAGEEFNVNSPKQLGQILFEKLKLPVIKKTKTGYSTDAEVLEKLTGEHPLINYLLEYRLLSKLKSTYLDTMDSLIHAQTGRIHTSFNQTVTATGRLSSSEPNLQNIPVRTEAGKRIRELFIPGEGYDYLVSADYSQIELRILAHLSNDENLIDAFRHNQDIHTRTASEVFGVAMDQVSSEMRSRAKAVNFGIVYGISDYGLSRDIGVNRKEAGQYIDNYFSRYQGVKRFIDHTVLAARTDGFVTTMFGRRRYLPDINSSNFNQRSFAERTAMNTPIQGTAADVIKKAMISVSRSLQAKGLRSRILLQVHDELVLEVPTGELDIVKTLVKNLMENAVQLAIPLTVDVKIGKNWAEAK